MIGNDEQDGGDQLLEQPAQAARTRLVLDRQLRDLLEHARLDHELHALVLENVAELVVEAVRGLGHDANHHLPVEVVKARDDGKAAGEFRNQSVREEIGWLHARVQPLENPQVVPLGRRDEAVAMRLRLDYLVQADEGAAADEQDVGGIDVLAAGKLDLRALHDLQHRMLDVFARAAAFRLVGRLQLVDLVDEDDAVLCLADVAVGLVDQALQDRLDLLAHVAGLRQRIGFRGHERNLEHVRQRGAEQGLPGAGRPDQQDVALGDRRVVDPRALDFLEVRIHGDRHDFLGVVLTDDVPVEILHDETRLHDRGGQGLPAMRHSLWVGLRPDAILREAASLAHKHRCRQRTSVPLRQATRRRSPQVP